MLRGAVIQRAIQVTIISARDSLKFYMKRLLYFSVVIGLQIPISAMAFDGDPGGYKIISPIDAPVPLVRPPDNSPSDASPATQEVREHKRHLVRIEIESGYYQPARVTAAAPKGSGTPLYAEHQDLESVFPYGRFNFSLMNSSLASKLFVLLLRTGGAAFCLGLSFIAVSSVSDSAWLGLIVSVMATACFADRPGRYPDESG